MEDQATEQSTEDRMMAYLEAEEAEPEDIEEEAPAATDEQEETATEPDEDTPEPRTLKIKRGEEEIEIPEDEARELAQKGYDYTKKTQAVAEERKAVEERAQAVQAQEQYLAQQFAVQQTLIKEVAKVEAINDQIAQYEALDWNAMSDSDPVQAQKLFFQYQQLTTKRERAMEELRHKEGQAMQVQQQRREQMLAQGMQQLVKDIPDWGAEKVQKVNETGKAYGFTDYELANVYDPRMVRVLHDAMQYRALQQSKPTAEKKVANKPPVVKPGGKDAKVAARSQNAELRASLKKTGRDEYAAKLIERMI